MYARMQITNKNSQVTSVEKGSIVIFFVAACSMIVPILTQDFYTVNSMTLYACVHVSVFLPSFLKNLIW